GRRRHTRFSRDWSSDVCSSDLSSAASMSVSDPATGGSSGSPPSLEQPARVPATMAPAAATVSARLMNEGRPVRNFMLWFPFTSLYSEYPGGCRVERGWCTSRRCLSSLLDASGAQPWLPVPLQEEEGGDDGDGRKERAHDHQVVDRLRGHTGRWGVPLIQPDGQRVPLRVAEHDQGKEVVVPRRNDREQRDRDDSGC